MKLDLQVDLGRDVNEIRERIIAECASQVLYGVSYDEDGQPHRISTSASRELREAMTKAIKAEVEKAVAPAVVAALEEGVQRTDTYGEPRGEKVPLRSIIVDEAAKALGKKVEIRDNYGRSESVVQQVVRDEVQKALAEELKAAIKEEREKVQAAVRGKAAEIITESVRRAVPV